MPITKAEIEATHARQPRYGRVLLVEDDDVLRATLRRNLERRGVRVKEAATVREALASCRRDVPDLLVLDLNLPDGSGWDVLRQLPLFGTVPPVLVTSAQRVTRRQLAAFGVEAFLPKPFRLEALMDQVVR